MDSNGAPAPVSMPDAKVLRTQLTFVVDGQEIHPFYAVASGPASQNMQGRLALVLVDISGSMNSRLSSGETRFDAAKAALNGYVTTFQDGLDQIAVAPFESHGVTDRIRGTSFARTRADALNEIATLPVPESRNNTGLYSAVSTGLEVLEAKRRELLAAKSIAPDTMLIVMTDGSNEVLKGDDADLLAGPAGLFTVANRVRAAAFPVIGIGFGDPGQIDIAALRQLSSHTYTAQDANTLQATFGFARKLLEDRILATFLSPWPDRSSLAAKTVQFEAELALPDGAKLSAQPAHFNAPAIGLPLYEGKGSRAEERALLESQPERGTETAVLRPVFVFLGISAALALLWFWAPRLIWPDRYLAIVPVNTRWAKPGQTGIRRGLNTKSMLPFGFSKDKRGEAPRRTPADPTFVQSRLGPRQIK